MATPWDQQFESHQAFSLNIGLSTKCNYWNDKNEMSQRNKNEVSTCTTRWLKDELAAAAREGAAAEGDVALKICRFMIPTASDECRLHSFENRRLLGFYFTSSPLLTKLSQVLILKLDKSHLKRLCVAKVDRRQLRLKNNSCYNVSISALVSRATVPLQVIRLKNFLLFYH